MCVLYVAGKKSDTEKENEICSQSLLSWFVQKILRRPKLAAQVEDRASGRVLKIYTTAPGVRPNIMLILDVRLFWNYFVFFVFQALDL